MRCERWKVNTSQHPTTSMAKRNIFSCFLVFFSSASSCLSFGRSVVVGRSRDDSKNCLFEYENHYHNRLGFSRKQSTASDRRELLRILVVASETIKCWKFLYFFTRARRALREKRKKNSSSENSFQSSWLAAEASGEHLLTFKRNKSLITGRENGSVTSVRLTDRKNCQS